MYYQESSDIEADGLQTLYLMNPNFMGYTDTQQHQQQHHQHSNMLFLNSNALNTASVPHAPPQHLVGVPLPASSLHNPNHHGLLQRMWSSVADQSQPHVPPPSTVVPGNPGGSTGGATTDLASQLGFHRPVAISPTQQQQQQQGCLSLSLSPQRQVSFRSVIPLNGDQHRDIRGSGASSSSINNGVSGMILGSKYLKVAQELLDEVVHVRKGIKEDDFDGDKDKSDMNKESIPLASGDVNNPTSGGDQTRVSDLTIAQRQELQMKKAKLVSMLEEVEQRYRQYHHQMQIIVTSFEQAAGSRSATPYTQMALHAISKQFRSLKDAIFGQIKSTSKNLGEEGAEEGLGVKNIEGSGLKFVDHHRRQQRALQQLGMTQTNAWRPQRGLPERAVSVLRGWLFEHFLHPYPKDSDKIMLAKQTGLTRSQVSNWFINARVRLWKPMVEDMYLEEVKNQEPNTTSEDKNHEANKELDSKSSTKHRILDKQEHSTSPTTQVSTSTLSTSPTTTTTTTTTNGFSFMEHTADHHQRNMKRPRNDTEIIKARGTSYKGFNDKFDNDERQTRESSSYPLMQAYNNIGDQFGRFNEEQLTTSTTLHHGNGVSLTLGLPPNSDQNQQNFISNHNVELETSHYNRMRNPQASSHPNITYETIDFQSGKRYAAQLLQDFVA